LRLKSWCKRCSNDSHAAWVKSKDEHNGLS
jgi:hypothetical protein